MNDVRIRPAASSERKELEALQWRASLSNAGDRNALLAHPDAIELTVEQIEAGGVFVAEWNGLLAGFSAVLPEQTERRTWTPCLSSPPLVGAASDAC